MAMDPTLISAYEDAAPRLRAAVAGLSPSEISRSWHADEQVGLWSIAHLVMHLADAEGAFADRIKRIIAEDEPALLRWDEQKFAQRLHYDSQSVEDALTIIELTRRQIAKILKKLSPADFERTGIHSERGRQTLADVVGFSTWHMEHHLKFVGKKKQKFGK